MYLRACIHNLGVQELFALLHLKQLPDGGFLCERRRGKLKYVPKSCYKADYYALRLPKPRAAIACSSKNASQPKSKPVRILSIAGSNHSDGISDLGQESAVQAGSPGGACA